MHKLYTATCRLCEKDYRGQGRFYCSRVCQIADSGLEHIKRELAKLHDDPTKHWSEYACLEWDRARSAGYGNVCTAKGKFTRAHRLSFELTNGPLQDGYHACHHCDNPPCFRPIHIFAGTRSDNIQDCARKGRLNSATYNRSGDKHWTKVRGSGPYLRGESHHAAKLTEVQVREIRAIVELSASKIACSYGVSKGLIKRIRAGSTWRHVV